MAAMSKYPAKLKERAVAMARELDRELGQGRGAIARVAAQLGIHPEALRYWVRRDEAGHPPAAVNTDAGRIAELERENRELRRTNEILKLASAFSRRKCAPRGAALIEEQ